MIGMPTEHLTLRKCRDGYYRAAWVAASGRRFQRSFGQARLLAMNRFARFHARWVADYHTRNPDVAPPATVGEAWQRFARHAAEHYRHADGSPTREADNLAAAFDPVLRLFGDLRADEFGPRSLVTVREAMIDSGLCLNEINKRVRKVRQVFKWLALQELVPIGTWHGLLTVDAIRAGRTTARTSAPVGPVPDAHVWAVVEQALPTIRAMILVQYHTGMRPGELCMMRPIDIDTAGVVWAYRPGQHKTIHRQRERVILLGPRAREAIEPYLHRELTACLFSPRETISQRAAGAPSHRRISCDSACDSARQTPRTERRVGTAYDAKGYALAIRRLCAEHGIPHWSPNQLRHSYATRVRQHFGLEAAQIMLGHARADVTQLYAERDLSRAREVVERIG